MLKNSPTLWIPKFQDLQHTKHAFPPYPEPPQSSPQLHHELLRVNEVVYKWLTLFNAGIFFGGGGPNPGPVTMK